MICRASGPWSSRRPWPPTPAGIRVTPTRAPPTRAAREAKGDPRPSIEERYDSRAAYLAGVRESAERLVAARHMLAEDVDAAVERAGRLWDFIGRA